ARSGQTEITKEIIKQKSNYVIALKENQKKSFEEAKDMMSTYGDSDYTDGRVSRHVSENTGHGRFAK
ncbi:MAG: ISAs1 family transposase, partial [Bacteroidaceae bacterium]|nr:ISAs1 family transposase [Bacteroidaceae bacterium]